MNAVHLRRLTGRHRLATGRSPKFGKWRRRDVLGQARKEIMSFSRFKKSVESSLGSRSPGSRPVWFVLLIALLALTTSCGGVEFSSNPDADEDKAAEAGDNPSNVDRCSDWEAKATKIEASMIGASGLGDTLFAGLGNGGYEVASYDVAIQTDPRTNQFAAKVAIEATAAQDLAMFNLDFATFDSTEVMVDGEPVEFCLRGEELTVIPAAPITEGEPFTIVVDYAGQPAAYESDVIDIQLGWVDTGDASYVVSEPDGAHSWLPSNDHPSDKAHFDFHVTVPEDLVAVANGLLVDTTVNDGGTKTWHWAAAEPMAPYLATVVVDDLELTEDRTESGLVIRNAFPSDYPAERRADFDEAGLMIEAMESLVGPYPFEAWGAVVVNVQDYEMSALETQTFAVFAPNRSSALAHEIAHQWFGNHVSLTQWNEIWLSEGFANYIPLLASESVGLIDDAQAEMLTAAHTFNSESPLQPPLKVDSEDAELFDLTVYMRGGATLAALDRLVGRDTFLGIIRTYLETYGGASATTDDFIAVAEEVSGQELQSFFTAWLVDETMPSIDLTKETTND